MTMKDLMLIDSSLCNSFWVEEMETVNYLQNRLLTRNRNYGEIILEEFKTRKRQNLQHICFFASFALNYIPDENRSKLDY